MVTYMTKKLMDFVCVCTFKFFIQSWPNFIVKSGKKYKEMILVKFEIVFGSRPSVCLSKLLV